MFNSIMFVSLGPGDPDLITLKGLKVLQQADIIFCPSTSTSSRAMKILQALDMDVSKVRLFEVPMSKNRSQAIECYENVASQIVTYHAEGLKIAVTAEGDAGFYSSIHYISDMLEQNSIPVERIAGIPAFIACGALGNIHIAMQEEKLIVIPGVTTGEELKRKIEEGMSVVIMKPSQSEEKIKSILGLNNVAFHYFENAGIPDKEFYTRNIQEIASRKFPYFSLLIIRK